MVIATPGWKELPPSDDEEEAPKRRRRSRSRTRKHSRSASVSSSSSGSDSDSSSPSRSKSPRRRRSKSRSPSNSRSRSPKSWAARPPPSKAEKESKTRAGGNFRTNWRKWLCTQEATKFVKWAAKHVRHARFDLEEVKREALASMYRCGFKDNDREILRSRLYAKLAPGAKVPTVTEVDLTMEEVSKGNRSYLNDSAAAAAPAQHEKPKAPQEKPKAPQEKPKAPQEKPKPKPKPQEEDKNRIDLSSDEDEPAAAAAAPKPKPAQEEPKAPQEEKPKKKRKGVFDDDGDDCMAGMAEPIRADTRTPREKFADAEVDKFAAEIGGELTKQERDMYHHTQLLIWDKTQAMTRMEALAKEKGAVEKRLKEIDAEFAVSQVCR